MIPKFFSRNEAALDQFDATGTYADGVFFLTLDKDAERESNVRLRSSYGRDYSIARKLDHAPAAFA